MSRSWNGGEQKGIKSRWYPETLAKRIIEIGEIRERFTFRCDDGIEVMRQHGDEKTSVFFIDPPYTSGGAKGKRAGARLYSHHHLNHEELFSVAANASGDILMTYDDAPDARALASRHLLQVESIAMKNTHHAKMTELLIGRDLSWLHG